MENRANTIRSLVPLQHWKHYPDKKNIADIPSRVMGISKLAVNPLWLHGPERLYSSGELGEQPTPPMVLPEECRSEMKRKDAAQVLMTLKDQLDHPLLDQHFSCNKIQFYLPTFSSHCSSP